MKARIRDLQIQAFAECKTFEDGKSRTDEVFERFAELVVQECVMVGGTAFLNDNSKVPIFPAKQIRDHFGVEE